MRRLGLLICCSLLSASLGAAWAAMPLSFGAPFSDHAILQRNAPIPVWGKAMPGTPITISLENDSVATTANANGEWRAILPARAAGGPYALSARNGNGAVQTLRDILVGDVWLCSGQSNMEFTVDRALNAKVEIEGSADDRLRFLTIPRTAAAKPSDRYAAPVRWAPASPETTGRMSAVCYFMGQALRHGDGAPVGLIAASWGGTAIDGWRSKTSLRAEGRVNERLDLLDLYGASPTKGLSAWSTRWESWWRAAFGDAPWEVAYRPGDNWRVVPAFKRWETWGDPKLSNYDGLVWYRTEVNLTAEEARNAEALSIGVADDIDNSWVNGRLVGTTGQGFDGVRSYTLPRGLLHAGRNVVTVNVRDLWTWGGLIGEARDRAILLKGGKRVLLNASWLYYAAPSVPSDVPANPWQSVGGLSTLYNGMIAPLGRYGLSGVAWYQGEANGGLADAPYYQAQLESLMADWRAQFDRLDLPFIIVQLPEYRAAETKPKPSGWAILREGQRQAVKANRHAALVVTMGLGSATDIHPADKKSVGLRAARAASWLTGLNASPPPGPAPVAARRQEGTIVVEFVNVSGELVALGSSHIIGFQVCDATEESCQFTDARIDGSSTVKVAFPPGAGLPARLRFCWADNPQCNLVDASGLPVGPFELPVDRY